MSTYVEGRGSWFGGPNDGMDSGKTAAGFTTARPGVAIRPGATYESGRPFLRGYWRVKAPNGRSVVLQQTDIGPNQSTGRRIDITYSALGMFGYKEGNFPTDAKFTATYLGRKKPAGGGKGGAKPVKPATGGMAAPASAAQTQSALLSIIANRQGSNQPVTPVSPGFSRA